MLSCKISHYLSFFHLQGQNLDKVPEKEQIVEMNGHQFKVQHYNVPTSCQLCHDTLWGARKQGYECIVCKYVCHKNCHSFVKDPCHEVLKLKTAKSIYFMTADPEEKRRWIHALEAYRKYHEEKGVGTGSVNFGTNSTISNSDKSGRSTLSKRDLSMNLSLPEDGNNGRRASIGM
ncbi:hypothetical protein BKA69DRAFT_1025414 [Paraphysoderma sedebokerense]|nr:hypothetical protein BKA69DRAFT_1025414 [Paraphysoderma sedebokerense]